MSYPPRIVKVIDYIADHLDQPITLDKLSDIACCSKFHFHRLFKVYVGVSLLQYIKWLRLKRAAHQLVIDSDKNILTIAMDAGFESHEAFTRAFKKMSGYSPSEFKDKLDWKVFENVPHVLFEKNKNVAVTIENKPEQRLAVISHQGDPAMLSHTAKALLDWMKENKIDPDPNKNAIFGIAYDDPSNVAAPDFRFDLGVVVSKDFVLNNQLQEFYLPAGRYAIALHHGSRHQIADTIYPLYHECLVTRGEILGDLPCVLRYLNFDHEVADSHLLTECWLLLK